MANQEILVEYLESFFRTVKISAHISKDSPLNSIIETVVQEFQEAFFKEVKEKSELVETLRQKEIEIKHLLEDLEFKEKTIEEQKTSMSRIQLQIENLENKFKKDLQKVAEERDSAKKELIKAKSQENQFKHEIKKKDLQINKIQNKLRESLSEKNFSYRNSAGEILISQNLSLNNTLPYQEFHKFLKNGQTDSESQLILTIQSLLAQLNQIFRSIQNVINSSGFRVDWKPFDFRMIDFNSSEVEFRLNDFENCMKNVRRLDEFEESTEEGILALKTIINGYRAIIESQFLEAMKV